MCKGTQALNTLTLTPAVCEQAVPCQGWVVSCQSSAPGGWVEAPGSLRTLTLLGDCHHLRVKGKERKCLSFLPRLTGSPLPPPVPWGGSGGSRGTTPQASPGLMVQRLGLGPGPHTSGPAHQTPLPAQCCLHRRPQLPRGLYSWRAGSPGTATRGFPHPDTQCESSWAHGRAQPESPPRPTAGRACRLASPS